ncbi:calpain family cysteine protease (macronuclear) [Tetrahymena thermophila SB210]|uniref:Calpain family cysteine protease n=1 Tax=Tetrahymena thermophila (strain SB210) TaxID=312017 RepID=I7MG03_TETTS|nr:calpain family cysteine protease [Tetrahymena thermophila SB210]EAR84634.1 calpain family cysteine protease [Tetrahymena thermophila SB210]|eukprot:XP_001032297.1 calpain family cysteine protease [Tetrahymena thermophila SB210]
MILIVITIIFLIIPGILKGQIINVNQIYSPLFHNQLQQNDSNWIPLKLKAISFNNWIFLSSGFSGITVISQEGDQILQIENIENNYIESFEVNSDASCIFIGIRNSLRVYSLTYLKNNTKLFEFQLQSTYTFPTDIQKMVYSESKELLVVGGRQGQVIVYDTTHKISIKQVAVFNTTSGVINGLFISKNGDWLYIASDLVGLFMLKLQEITLPKDSLDSRQIQLILAGHGTYGIISYQVIATSDNFYIFAIDFWYGFFYANSQQIVQSSVNQYPFNINFNAYWPFHQFNPTCQSLILNSQETFLFLGVRSQGIFIFDIRDREQIKFFQQINSDSLVYSIQFSIKEDFLYFSDATKVFTFQQEQINLNENFPNLFNIHQIKYGQLPTQNYKWRCYTDANDDYLIGAFDYSGLFIFPIRQNPYNLDTSVYKFYDLQVDSIYFEPSGKYMVIPQYFSEYLLGIYQYEPLDNSPEQQNISLENTKLIKQYDINQLQITEMITFSFDRQYAVQTYGIGLIIYNATDIFNIQILSRWNTPDFMQGENQGACITNDNNWILSTIRLFGVYLLNIQDKSKPFLSDYKYTLGGESIIISSFQNYAYLIDGIKGFAIIDTNFFPKINIISRISLPGYCVMGLLIQDEQYIFVTTMERGMLTLIDIRDKRFPTVVNAIIYEKQYGMAICMPNNSNYIFVTTSAGIITFPIYSGVKMHTSVSLISQNQLTQEVRISKYEKRNIQGDQNTPTLNDEYIFYVGEQIQFNFAILYPIDENMHISDIYFYQDGQMVKLPSFFSFDQFQQSIQFQTDKALLGSSKVNLNLNIILIKTVIPLNSNSFIFNQQNQLDKAITNQQQSQYIYQSLLQQNILDSNSIISESYDFTKALIFDLTVQQQILDPSVFQDQNLKNIVLPQIIWKINLSLMKSFYINPIKFYIQPSLKFNSTQTSQFITTNSQAISVTLQIDNKSGKLILRSVLSVAFQISDQKDQIIITGTVVNVNAVLQQKIVFANITEITSTNSSNITITVVDSINYPIVQVIPIFQCQFISLKQQLVLNAQNTLQDQIYNQFSEGILFIESEITISFSHSTFLVEDVSDISYEYFYLTSNGNYISIPPNLWLQQMDGSSLTLKGQTTASMYLKSYTFKIIASDGYTKAEDTFTIIISGVPLNYVLNLLFKILGPIVFVLGMYKQRSIFLNIIFSNKVTYSEEIAICNQPFVKQIIMLGSLQQDSKQIVNQLFSKVLVKMKQQIQIDSSSQNKERKISFDLKSESEKDSNIFNICNNSNEDFKNFQESKLQLTQKKINPKSLEKMTQSISKNKKHSVRSILERKYLNQNGSINTSQIICDIQSYNLNLTQSNFNYENEIQDPNSRIQVAIRAYISRYFLSLDKKSQKAYENIKRYCLQFLHQQENDWYKQIVIIKYDYDQKDIQNQQNLSIFPKIDFQYLILTHIFQSFKLFPDKLQETPNNFKEFLEFEAKYKTNINIYLIRDVIFADVLGFKQFSPSKFKPSVGQSIHLFSYEIKQIIAYKKKNIKDCLKPVFKFFNLDYTKYGISKNMRLPAWIYLDQKRGMIVMRGVPQYEDSEEVLIKIKDYSGYVVQQFLLKIRANASQQMQNNENTLQTLNLSNQYDLNINHRKSQYKFNTSPFFKYKDNSQINFSQYFFQQQDQTKSIDNQKNSGNFKLSLPSQQNLELQSLEEEGNTFNQKSLKIQQIIDYQFRRNKNSKNITQISNTTEEIQKIIDKDSQILTLEDDISSTKCDQRRNS